MKRILFGHVFMAPAGEGGGASGGADGGDPAPTPTPTPEPATETAAETAPATTPANDISQVTLQDGEAQNPEQTPEPAPSEINEEDYATKVAIDADIASDVAVDPNAMKAVAPLLKEAGVSVEMAGRLVNALAKYQLETFKQRNQERYEDNKRMHDAAVRKYSKADFAQINAGIDAAFARNGVMNFIVRNSEIGNDPEFLELMKWYGAHHPTNAQPTGTSGFGGTTGQAAGYTDISKAWS